MNVIRQFVAGWRSGRSSIDWPTFAWAVGWLTYAYGATWLVTGSHLITNLAGAYTYYRINQDMKAHLRKAQP